MCKLTPIIAKRNWYEIHVPGGLSPIVGLNFPGILVNYGCLGSYAESTDNSAGYSLSGNKKDNSFLFCGRRIIEMVVNWIVTKTHNLQKIITGD